MQIGEAFISSGPNAAHVNTVLGERGGPAGHAWATALATPTPGHQRFAVIARPGVPVQPPTLFVNKATFVNDNHGLLHWGPAQAGIATGVTRAVREGIIEDPSDLALICAVWVNPAADDPDAVYRNNAEASFVALGRGASGEPTATEIQQALPPSNPFFTAPE